MLSSLTSITIPASVESIGSVAFAYTSKLESILVDENNNYYSSLDGVLFNKNKTILLKYPTGSSRVSYTVPSSVETIEGRSFAILLESDNNTLRTIILNNGLKNINTFAFRFVGIEWITIPASVTSIGRNAFYFARNLTNVYLPSPNGLDITSPSEGPVSFFGTTNVTISAELIRSRSEVVTAVIANADLISLLSTIGVNAAGISSAIEEVPSDSNIAYRARLTIPSGNLSALSEEQKVQLINKVKQVYALESEVNINKLVVTLSAGSIVLTVVVLADGVTVADYEAALIARTPICFPAGTPVTTNQGAIAIEKLNPSKHTIRGKEIVAITQTRPLHKYIVLIEKDALGVNVPSADTEISKEHKVYYKGGMVKAKDLVEMCEGVSKIPYNGETLYNVLLKTEDKMMVNNLICETLSPNNIMAKICGGKYNGAEQRKICEELNEIIKTDNVPAYKKLYASLK
jgi:hypothetical protein